MGELEGAALVLARDMAKIKRGEHVLIYADTLSSSPVAEATFKAALGLGAKALLALYGAPRGVGAEADEDLPSPLRAAMKEADVIIELSKQYLLYSRAWEEAMERGKAKFLCLSGMDEDMLIRLVGRVPIPLLERFEEKLAALTASCRSMRVRTRAGTDISFENDASRPVFREGIVGDKPGEYMLIGQVDWAPVEETIEGVIVFDGSVWPPEEIGVLKEPIRLHVRSGKVVEVEGGDEARLYERWLKRFNAPSMLNIAHISYGCNPGARLTGRIVEDERVWGCVQWGLGHQAASFLGKAGPAPSHSDGICLRATVEGDGALIMKEGSYVHPELEPLEKEILASYSGLSFKRPRRRAAN
jgi:2,5-dihydroxypyridine 5,6-dioxygenase